ncbi:MAG: AMP-binding protein [Gammaproteobacteria bacterium]|nr:AMP-binding protein [Gammaproteobacteria bacterium]
MDVAPSKYVHGHAEYYKYNIEHMDIHNYFSFVDIIYNRFSKTPQKLVFKFLNTSDQIATDITYERLFLRSQIIAAMLLEHVSKYDRCLLLFPPGLAYIEALIGCISAEVIAIPAYPPMNNRLMHNIRNIIKDSDCNIILTTEKLRGRFADSFENVELLATDTLEESIHSTPIVSPKDIDLDATAIIQYTSGSTGFPKGVMISHRNLSHNSMQSALAFQVEPTSINVSWLPPYHDMGLIGAILNPLYDDVLSILMPPTQFLQSPFRWLRAISEFGATHSGAPNFAYELCCQKITSEQKSTLNLSSWKVAFNGAEPIRKETLHRFYETFKECGLSPTTLRPCYGLAEATLIASSSPTPHEPFSVSVSRSSLETGKIEISTTAELKTHVELVSCGSALVGQNIVIVDPASLEKCADNVVGEIWIQGPSIAKGYWNNKIESEYTFNAYIKNTSQGPFLRTGDLGFISQERIFVTGRLKDLIIINGRNLYPQDLEFSAKNSHNAFMRGSTAAFSVSDQNRAEQLIIVQEIDKRYKGSTLKLLDAIRQATSGDFNITPSELILVSLGTLPRTTSGKIQRKQTKSLYKSEGLVAIDEWKLPIRNDHAFQTFVEKKSSFQSSQPWNQENITAWITQYIAKSQNLSENNIYPEQTFSSLGLGSVEAVELTATMEKFLGFPVSPMLAWNYPTIKEAASFLAEEYLIQNKVGCDETDQEAQIFFTPGTTYQEAEDGIDISKLSNKELAKLLSDEISEPSK